MITKEQVELKKITNNISQIKKRIVVFSSKRGIGKTTVSVNLSYALQVHSFKTGILDADITGLNIPKMKRIYP